MPIYIKHANLFINKAAVDRKYAGGIEQFRLDYKIKEDNFHEEDNELFAFAQMNADDFDIDELISQGFHYDKELHFSSDFTILQRYGSYLWNTDWITDNTIFAWHIETSEESIVQANIKAEEPFDSIAEKWDRGENPHEPIL